MQFEALKVFCDVARNQSFSRAADTNHISQSAVSQIVNQLEKRLGVQLVDRSRRPLQLTHSGKAYYEGCKKLVEQYLEVESSIRNGNGSRMEVPIRVAAIYSVGLRDMSQYVQRFVAQQPGVHIEIEYLHPDRVTERVLDGTADFGLISFPEPSRKLASIPWREEEMVVACGPTHPLVAEGRVKVSQLARLKYVGFDKDLVIRRKVDRFLRDHGVSVDVVLEFDNVENIKQAIEISAGVALLPLPALAREVRAGTIAAVPLRDARFVRPLGILHRRNPNPSPTAQRFIELLRQPDDPISEDQPVSGLFAAGHKAPAPSAEASAKTGPKLASRGNGK
jgi:DNA-binding transcriptional LysR family regulator